MAMKNFLDERPPCLRSGDRERTGRAKNPLLPVAI